MAIGHRSPAPSYVPLLKGKKGEYDALRHVPRAVRAQMLPLIDVPPVRWDYKKKCYAKTLEEHLAPVPELLAKSWGAEWPVLVDLFFVEEGATVANGVHPVEFVLGGCHSSGVRAVPVTGPDRPDDFQAAVKAVAHQKGTGVCLRIPLEHDVVDLRTLGTQAEALRSELALGASACDLVVDLRHIDHEELGRIPNSVAAAIAAVPRLDEYRSLILAGSGFPATLSKVKQQSEALIPRTELWLWRAVSEVAKAERQIIYGDYAVAHPDLQDVDPRSLHMSANLRYTLSDHWLVLKGRDVKKFTYAQFRGLCRKLISSGQFAGRGESWGDALIADCAAAEVGSGNATTWREIGTSHHLAVVMGQLASRRAA